MDAPLPLDTGGAQIQGRRQALGLLLGLLIGFGTGHLLIRDRWLPPVPRGGRGHHRGEQRLPDRLRRLVLGLGGLGLLISHVIQGVDVLGKAAGPRVVEETRRKAVLVSDARGGRRAPSPPAPSPSPSDRGPRETTPRPARPPSPGPGHRLREPDPAQRGGSVEAPARPEHRPLLGALPEVLQLPHPVLRGRVQAAADALPARECGCSTTPRATHQPRPGAGPAARGHEPTS